MSDSEIIQMLSEIRDYLTAGNPVWDTAMVRETMDVAISDVMSVRHGHWEGKIYKCSLCGKWIDPLQGDADMNYCPNCGARMDGGNNE